MRSALALSIITTLGVAATGCANHNSSVADDPGYRQSGTSGSDARGTVDPSRNSLNHTGTGDQNGGSSAQSGRIGG